MMQEIKEKLRELANLLQAGGESDFVHTIDRALKTGEAAITDLLVSNDLWGGAGSIADQALIQNKELRKQLQYVLIELGELQQKIGKVNVRTEMWASTFRQWRDQDTIQLVVRAAAGSSGRVAVPCAACITQVPR